MKHFLILSCFPLIALSQANDSTVLRRFYDYYLTKSNAYTNLGQLCSTIGSRLSGSPEAEKAVHWAEQLMQSYGADSVFLQECPVPHWVRGKKEICTLTSNNKKTDLKCLALGSSVGTGDAGLRASVIEVSGFDELDRLRDRVKGKIVFYNVFFDQTKIRTGDAYGETVKYRSDGASHAAKYGAVATLVRSMTSVADDEPHTGNMRYDITLSMAQIPAVALSYKAADELHEALKANANAEIYLETHCQRLRDGHSFNVIAQINGSEKPDEYIVAGGHLDSWDVGQGAHDDGAGIVQCIELLRAFKQEKIRPKHSIRIVAFMNEENGTAGGNMYAKIAKRNNEKHLTALEADAGGFTPRSLHADTANGLYKMVLSWSRLFHPYLIDRIEPDGGGTDLIALEKTGVPCLSYEPDSQRYFDIHHTAADTFDKVNKRELDLGGATIASLIYLIDKYK